MATMDIRNGSAALSSLCGLRLVFAANLLPPGVAGSLLIPGNGGTKPEFHATNH
jgi:hypothetical protein